MPTTKKTLEEKLGEFQALVVAQKTERNTFAKFDFRTVSGILTSAKPIAAKLGCSILTSDKLELVGEKVFIVATAALVDNSTKERVEVTGVAEIPEHPPKGMSAPQASGSSSTYARKYALCGLLAIDDGDGLDPDFTENMEAAAATEPKFQKKVAGVTAKNKKIKEICSAVASVSTIQEFGSLWKEHESFILACQEEYKDTKHEAHFNALWAHMGYYQLQFINLGPNATVVKERIEGACDGKQVTEKWDCYTANLNRFSPGVPKIKDLLSNEEASLTFLQNWDAATAVEAQQA